MSKATGTMDLQSGQFHLTLTSLDGNGPTGEVTGTKDPNTGVVTTELDGPGCSKLTLGPLNARRPRRCDADRVLKSPTRRACPRQNPCLLAVKKRTYRRLPPESTFVTDLQPVLQVTGCVDLHLRSSRSRTEINPTDVPHH
jgi:hypothetical protein